MHYRTSNRRRRLSGRHRRALESKALHSERLYPPNFGPFAATDSAGNTLEGHMNMKSGLQVLGLSLLLLMAGSAGGQSGTSAVQGSVLDSSGAGVPAADVVLRNSATDVVLKATSGDSGTYSFPS